jgi:hypothetical protein
VALTARRENRWPRRGASPHRSPSQQRTHTKQNVYFKKDEEVLLRKLLSKVKSQADKVRR